MVSGIESRKVSFNAPINDGGTPVALDPRGDSLLESRGDSFGTTAPFLIDAREAARVCGVGLTKWKAFSDPGRIPAPVRLSERKVLWRLDELRSWVHDGCPPRHKWEWPTASEGEA